jgi:hypothetical protein
MATEQSKQYIYIAQAAKEPSFCKIGKTKNLERRLKDYNNTTGKSQDNAHEYLFACETSDMAALKKAIKEKFGHLREKASHEIYFYNPTLFKEYVKFIKITNVKNDAYLPYMNGREIFARILVQKQAHG